MLDKYLVSELYFPVTKVKEFNMDFDLLSAYSLGCWIWFVFVFFEKHPKCLNVCMCVSE